MTTPAPDPQPKSRWLWVGVIALLAVAAVIMFINPDGDETVEEIPDYAITTEEEALNPPMEELNEPGDEEIDELLNGGDAQGADTVQPVVIEGDEDAEPAG